ncbi:probable LRR receptor-like serine/threonine-protein kinase At3g47570 [Actinidia eriantha]|uniref:probable LRR receptor-like serine/threonine-protein kinase At3g47570 n=1 Tax=Actinidia eriantha TaxID=165200 RepID=UPI00258D10A3|nr:probable LRR receptor-like serine/threonine-protein kinase At3g47570 [Actinidia eriantha]
MSPHIGNLNFLKNLIINNNSLGNKIPQEIGNFFRLQILALENNSFTGEIPVNISRCSGLTYLGFDGNKLEGKIPMELGVLTTLEVLVLRFNNLTGEIPDSFRNFTALTILSATENNLEGNIPDSLGQLTSLSRLAFGGNKLNGTVPPSIYNISSLIELAIPVNQVQGSLPRDMFLLNRLSGALPVSISNATNLLTISISRNQLTGKVPSLANLHRIQGFGSHINNLGNGEDDDLNFLSSLVNSTDFELLSLSDNKFGGELPKTMGNLSIKLRSIGLGRNQIVGVIPSGIGNLIGLDVLSLEDNQLTGGIPYELGKIQKLKYLWLRGNDLSGEIPPSLGNLTLLYGLNLAQSNLQGKIPSTLGNCSLLNILSLSQNKLTGAIPREVMGISSLSIILDLSNNYLSEALPIEGNFFQGMLPSSLSSLKGIVSLDLSRNNFTGQIPEFLESFTSLHSLNLSFNDFEGEVPLQGVFKNASEVSIIENMKLCGGVPELQLPKCGVKELNNAKLSLAMKLTIYIVSGLLTTTVIAFLVWCWLRKKREGLSSKPSFHDSSPYLHLPYGKLLEATDGFSSKNLIGVGAFGLVYKGILDQGKTIVAVKVLNLQHKGASKSFMAECEALRNLRHRNLVKILTVCSGVDSRGNDFKALVYEFMANGSLDEWLHPIPNLVESRKLNFLKRLDIGIDIANALEYIHHGHQTPIVHCDLKPSNVLMDEDMTARVGDFGLARSPLQIAHLSSADQTGSLVVKGTIGYAAPEYGMGSEVSVYGDIYSYGVIVLELFTGKRPTNDMFTDGLNLHNFAKMALPDRVMEILDPTLVCDIEEEEEKAKRECLACCLKLGLLALWSPQEKEWTLVTFAESCTW